MVLNRSVMLFVGTGPCACPIRARETNFRELGRNLNGKRRYLKEFLLETFAVPVYGQGRDMKTKDALAGEKSLQMPEADVAFLKGQSAGRVFHTFTENDLRNQILSFSPEMYKNMSPENVDKLFSKYEKKYALEIETARVGISSDKQMAEYLEKSGIAEKLGMDKDAVLKSLKGINSQKHYLKPLGKFAEYHTLKPPPEPAYLPGEFGPAGAVYTAWPLYDGFVWKVHVELVKEIMEAADMWIFVPNEYWQKAVELYLTKKGVKLSNVKFLHVPIDDQWARNWGQLTVLCGKDKNPAFVHAHYVGYAFQAYAKKSAMASIAFGQYMNVPVYQLPLVCEQGGNIISDGNGTIIVTQRIFEQNPDVGENQFKKILENYYGCKQLIVLPKLKGEVNGHADFIKFADPHTIFVCSAPEDSAWYETLEYTALTLANSRAIDGKNYKIIRLPTPTNYKHGEGGVGWNYNCSLTINGRQKKLIVPVYGAPEDKKALEIYRKSLPDYKVVGIDYRIYVSGAINCQTQEVPPEVTKRIK